MTRPQLKTAELKKEKSLSEPLFNSRRMLKTTQAGFHKKDNHAKSGEGLRVEELSRTVYKKSRYLVRIDEKRKAIRKVVLSLWDEQKAGVMKYMINPEKDPDGLNKPLLNLPKDHSRFELAEIRRRTTQNLKEGPLVALRKFRLNSDKELDILKKSTEEGKRAAKHLAVLFKVQDLFENSNSVSKTSKSIVFDLRSKMAFDEPPGSNPTISLSRDESPSLNSSEVSHSKVRFLSADPIQEDPAQPEAKDKEDGKLIQNEENKEPSQGELKQSFQEERKRGLSVPVMKRNRASVVLEPLNLPHSILKKRHSLTIKSKGESSGRDQALLPLEESKADFRKQKGSLLKPLEKKGEPLADQPAVNAESELAFANEDALRKRSMEWQAKQFRRKSLMKEFISIIEEDKESNVRIPESPNKSPGRKSRNTRQRVLFERMLLAEKKKKEQESEKKGPKRKRKHQFSILGRLEPEQKMVLSLIKPEERRSDEEGQSMPVYRSDCRTLSSLFSKEILELKRKSSAFKNLTLRQVEENNGAPVIPREEKLKKYGKYLGLDKGKNALMEAAKAEIKGHKRPDSLHQQNSARSLPEKKDPDSNNQSLVSLSTTNNNFDRLSRLREFLEDRRKEFENAQSSFYRSFVKTDYLKMGMSQKTMENLQGVSSIKDKIQTFYDDIKGFQRDGKTDDVEKDMERKFHLIDKDLKSGNELLMEFNENLEKELFQDLKSEKSGKQSSSIHSLLRKRQTGRSKKKLN